MRSFLLSHHRITKKIFKQCNSLNRLISLLYRKINVKSTSDIQMHYNSKILIILH